MSTSTHFIGTDEVVINSSTNDTVYLSPGLGQTLVVNGTCTGNEGTGNELDSADPISFAYVDVNPGGTPQTMTDSMIDYYPLGLFNTISQQGYIFSCPDSGFGSSPIIDIFQNVSDTWALNKRFYVSDLYQCSSLSGATALSCYYPGNIAMLSIAGTGFIIELKDNVWTAATYDDGHGPVPHYGIWPGDTDSCIASNVAFGIENDPPTCQLRICYPDGSGIWKSSAPAYNVRIYIPVGAACICCDDNYCYVGNPETSTIYAYDKTGTLYTTIVAKNSLSNFGLYIDCCIINGDTYVATTDGSKVYIFRIFPPSSGYPFKSDFIFAYDTGGVVSAIKFSCDGKYVVYKMGSTNKFIQMIDHSFTMTAVNVRSFTLTDSVDTSLTNNQSMCLSQDFFVYSDLSGKGTIYAHPLLMTDPVDYTSQLIVNGTYFQNVSISNPMSVPSYSGGYQNLCETPSTATWSVPSIFANDLCSKYVASTESNIETALIKSLTTGTLTGTGTISAPTISGTTVSGTTVSGTTVTGTTVNGTTVNGTTVNSTTINNIGTINTDKLVKPNYDYIYSPIGAQSSASSGPIQITSFTSISNNGITNSSGNLTVSKAGLYTINLNITVSGLPPWDAQIRIGGNVVSVGSCYQSVSDIWSQSMTWTGMLAASSVVSFYIVIAPTGGTITLTANQSNMSIFRIN